MPINRRGFLRHSAAAAAALGFSSRAEAAGAPPDLRLGVCDWSLGAKGREAFEIARRIGLDGLQISPRGPADVLSYATAEEQEEIREAMRATGLAVASAGLNIANQFPVAEDPRAPAWLIQTVDAAAELGARATLIGFFGKGNLLGADKKLKKAETDILVERLKAAAPHAEDKGVALGLENTLSAEQNLEILERVGSPAVQVYYDIANSTSNGYDVPAEIRALKGRICEIHFKNTEGVFGRQGLNCVPIAEAMRETGYAGWIVFEKSFGEDKEAYFRQNAEYVRALFGLKTP